MARGMVMRVSSLGDVWAHSGPGPGHGPPAKQGGLLGLDQMVEAGAGARVRRGARRKPARAAEIERLFPVCSPNSSRGAIT
jgi:hypothetical protein